MYYNQTNIQEIEKVKIELESRGFKVSISKAFYEIKRETSKYNKYMKWHLIEHLETGSICSNYFKSKNQCLNYINKSREPLPIGDRISMMFLQKAIMEG